MATSVRVEEAVKADLDRLQGLVQAETGERLSHSDLLARLLKIARRHEDEMMAEHEDWRPMSAQELDRFLDRLTVTGVATNVRNLDEDLYGERP